jgi:hypothetical protein
MMALTFGIEFQAYHLVANNQGLFFVQLMQCLANNFNI